MYKIKLKKNQKYSFCTCAKSKTMPYCDNQHRLINKNNKIKFKSIKLIASNDTIVEMKSKMWIKDE